MQSVIPENTQKVLSSYGEYDEFRFIYRIQNRLGIRGKYINVIGECVERI
jgi:hypothetical protein